MPRRKAGNDVSSINALSYSGRRTSPLAHARAWRASCVAVEARPTGRGAEVASSPMRPDAMDGMVLSENLILEIVRPVTAIRSRRASRRGRVTTFIRTIRWSVARLGDGSTPCSPAPRPAGRTTRASKAGWGRRRSDHEVKGMFVGPIYRRGPHGSIPTRRRVRLVVSR